MYNVIFNRGNCYRKLGKLDESIEDLKKAVEMKQDKAAAHNNLGLSLFEKEDFGEALLEFSKAIQCEDHALHYNNRGLAHYHMKDSHEDAKKDFDEAIKRDKDDPYFYFNRGNVYLD
jgi:tetratricopeptide (TPR) repeat protein